MAQIRRGVSLQPFNTFGIDVRCDHFTELGSVEDFRQLVRDPVYKKSPRLILGGGSNVLFRDDFKGLVIMNRMKGKEIIGEDNESALVRIAAGEVWHETVEWTISKGLGGLENLSLIPGCVGASPMQNIGAYGVEIKDVFVELEAYSMDDGAGRKFDKAQCRFGYRESVFKRELKDQYLIGSVTFRLSKNPVVNTTYGAIGAELQAMNITRPGIKDVSEAVIRIRRSKLPDPAILGNAGSFFKNPEVSAEKHASLLKEFPALVAYELPNGRYKLAAGWLIEQCGLKGFEMNGAAVHDRQALVLVNKKRCSGSDVYRLSEHVLQSVKNRFGVELEREVNIIP